MSLVTNLTTAFTAVGTAVKATRVMIGTLSSLTTTEKSNLVGAINEVKASISAAGPAINDTTPSGSSVYSSNKVVTELALKANLASPTFTGTPTAPTPSAADNSTKVATTAYVDTSSGTRVPTSRTINAKPLTADIVLAWSDFAGLIPTSALPPLAINETFAPANQTAMLALTAQRGDMAIRVDNGFTYVLATDSPSTLADWKQITAAGSVTSVAGKTGAVSLVVADVSGAVSTTDVGDTARDFATDFTTALNS